ncbi:MAG: fibronectin type III domain-containing protein [Steroidobacteraceae bacterium]
MTLSWEVPTERTDGTTLANLAGYKIHYGTTSQSYTNTVSLSNPGLTAYVVDNLPAGTYYFAISAYDSTGIESPLSGQAVATVN